MALTVHDELASQAPGRTLREPISFLTCAVVLLAAVVTLRVAGLRRAISLARRATARRPAHSDVSIDCVEVVAHRIATAAAFMPLRARCLEQSLALFSCARLMALDVKLIVGVQPYPFLAHAWIEYRHCLVGTTLDRVSSFLPILTLGGR